MLTFKNCLLLVFLSFPVFRLKRLKDLMQMLGLCKVFGQLAKAHSVCSYGCVLMWRTGNFVEKELDLNDKGHDKTWKPYGDLKNLLDGEFIGLVIRKDDVPFRS